MDFIANCQFNLYSEYRFDKLSEKVEVLTAFFKSLNLQQLTTLGMTSKKWKSFTDTAPIWINICREAHLFPIANSKPSFFMAVEYYHPFALVNLARIYSNNLSLDCAISNITTMLSDGILFGEFKLEVIDLLHVLTLKKMLERINHDYEKINDTLFHLLTSPHCSIDDRQEAVHITAQLILTMHSTDELIRTFNAAAEVIDSHEDIDT